MIIVYIQVGNSEMSEVSLKEQFIQAGQKKYRANSTSFKPGNIPHNKKPPVPEIVEPDTGLKLSEKGLAFKLLRESGVPVKKAAEMIGINTNYGYQIDGKLKKYDVTDNKLQSHAYKAVKNLTQAKTFGELTEIKCSTVLAAAREVLDRSQPKVNLSQSINAEVSFTNYDLSLLSPVPVQKAEEKPAKAVDNDNSDPTG